jgi:uncharacterized surface protein with fasciclin (FAS1) repeats
MRSLLDTIYNTRELSIFSKALKITSLDKILTNNCDFTIFAPDNLAFAQLSKVNLNFLSQDIWLLTEVLSLHIISGKLGYQDLLKVCQPGLKKASILSIDSSIVEIDLSNGIGFGNSKVLSTDTTISNGIVYLIDRVLTPIRSN